MTTDIAVVNGQLLLPDGVQQASLVIGQGRIAAIGEVEANWKGRIIDAQQMLVVPGFIDIQLNGGFGEDFTRNPGSIWKVAERLPEYGVTAFLPTIISSPPDALGRAHAALRNPPSGFRGATPLGLHLEGPMLNPLRAGAHPPEHLQPPSEELIATWSAAAGVVMVTIAPELPGAFDVIAELAARGVVVAAGHSDATSKDAAAAVEAGVTTITHLYNAMSPLKHREPGLVGFALARNNVTASIIVDGIHIAPEAVAAAWNAKGSEGLVLISDAVAAQGMPDGSYTLGETALTVEGDSVRTAAGTLAGTNLTMPRAIGNLVAFTSCTVSEAICSATLTPAKLIGLSAKGRIEVGADADIVLFDDDLRVRLTFIGGRAAYDPDNFVEAV